MTSAEIAVGCYRGPRQKLLWAVGIVAETATGRDLVYLRGRRAKETEMYLDDFATWARERV
ncbi:hypothetical protein EPN42_09235 [bacterium]|nr:MAG: hypothetical protein EPN42_09235 [bacterium]